MTLAITESDNAAAESIWGRLGDPVTAAHKVEDVLRQTGDPTIVQSQRVRRHARPNESGQLAEGPYRSAARWQRTYR
jgi:hypothetical protein